VTVTVNNGHSWSEEWSLDEENHWRICENSSCSEITDKNVHADGTDADYACDACGYICYIQELSLDKTEAELKNGETLQLTATIIPADATNQTLKWTSSEETVATVTEDGLVTAVGVGEVTITAETQDGSGLSASCVIDVVWEEIVIEPTEIQSGEVEMLIGVPYKLTEGNWMVEGDDTIYSGGSTVYVSESGTYHFTEQ